MAADPTQVLLQQIGELMQQYLQLGPDTPLAQTFQQVLPEVQGAVAGPEGGAMPPAGGPPMGPDMGQGPMPPEGAMPPEEMGTAAVQALSGMQGNDAFANASKQAGADMASGNLGKKKKSSKEKSQSSKK